MPHFWLSNALSSVGFIRIVAPKVAGSSPVGHPSHKTRGLQRTSRSRAGRRPIRAAGDVRVVGSGSESGLHSVALALSMWPDQHTITWASEMDLLNTCL
jgi:hypothetical protein